MVQHNPLADLQAALLRGQIGRRDFIRRAVAIGLSSSAIAAALAACGSASTATPATTSGATSSAAGSTTAASTTTASAATGSGAASASPATGATPGKTAGAAPTSAGPAKRGGGGAVKILQWQGPTILNPHLSSGTKDDLVCRIVYEALMSVDAEGNYVPVLADAIPTQQNGQLAADGKSVTWKLKHDVKWSDSQPFNADDVVFTWEYVTDKATAATSVSLYEGVDKVEKVDDYTVKYTFTEPNPAWFRPAMLAIIPQHVFQNDKGAPARNSQNNLKPVGTGPYKVKPGDTVSYAINENYREANKPYFDTVQVKGGGDAPTAARAVLQTGDYDYAWNLQVEDTILKQLESSGKGVTEFIPAGGIEMVFLNFTDPNKEVDGERSSLKAPHPFLTDPKVRQALALGADRDTVVKVLYGRGGETAVNVLQNPPQFRSNNNKVEFNLDKANALLEEAGYKKGSDGVRSKGDVKLTLLFQTTANSIRQKTQQILKDAWEKLGMKVELKSIDSSVFFSSDAGNPDTNAHFYADLEMYTPTETIDPQSYMRVYVSRYADQKANQWSGGNRNRYQNPDYDKLWDAARAEMDAQKRAQSFIKINDIVVQDVVRIPLVNRKGVSARAKTLQNINLTPWDSEYWNIANWTRG